MEEKDCGEGPNLEIIFEDDTHMNDIQEKIIVMALHIMGGIVVKGSFVAVYVRSYIIIFHVYVTFLLAMIYMYVHRVLQSLMVFPPRVV